MILPGWEILPASPFAGSFLGVLVRRWPAGAKLAWSRSRCETCAHPLNAADLVPLASFALTRGSCRHCAAPIAWFHPAIELAALAIALAVLAADGNTASAWFDALLGWTLLAAAWIDAETHRLPDVLTLPLLLAGLFVTGLEAPASLYGHATAAALGWLGFRLLDAGYRALRGRDGLGAGDAKLLAAGGAWLGLASLPDVIAIAGLIGIAMIFLRDGPASLRVRPTRPIAFGPALALAILACRLLAR